MKVRTCISPSVCIGNMSKIINRLLRCLEVFPPVGSVDSKMRDHQQKGFSYIVVLYGFDSVISESVCRVFSRFFEGGYSILPQIKAGVVFVVIL